MKFHRAGFFTNLSGMENKRLGEVLAWIKQQQDKQPQDKQPLHRGLCPRCRSPLVDRSFAGALRDV